MVENEIAGGRDALFVHNVGDIIFYILPRHNDRIVCGVQLKIDHGAGAANGQGSITVKNPFHAVAQCSMGRFVAERITIGAGNGCGVQHLIVILDLDIVPVADGAFVFHPLQSGTAVECGICNEVGPGRQMNDLQCSTAVEGVDGNAADIVRDGDFRQAGATCKNGLAKVLQIVREDGLRKAGAVLECIAANGVQMFGELDPVQLGAGFKGAVTNKGQRFRQDQERGGNGGAAAAGGELLLAGKGLAAVESPLTDGSQLVGKPDGGSTAAELERLLFNGGHAVRQPDAVQAGALIESLLRDHGNTVRDVDLGQAGTVIKAAHAKAGKLLGKGDRFQCRAAVEGIVSDGKDTGRVQLLQGRAVAERGRTDFHHFMELDVFQRGAAVKNAILQPEETAANVKAFQLFAVFKGIWAQNHQVIGKVGPAQGKAARKGVVIDGVHSAADIGAQHPVTACKRIAADGSDPGLDLDTGHFFLGPRCGAGFAVILHFARAGNGQHSAVTDLPSQVAVLGSAHARTGGVPQQRVQRHIRNGKGAVIPLLCFTVGHGAEGIGTGFQKNLQPALAVQLPGSLVHAAVFAVIELGSGGVRFVHRDNDAVLVVTAFSAKQGELAVIDRVMALCNVDREGNVQIRSPGDDLAHKTDRYAEGQAKIGADLIAVDTGVVTGGRVVPVVGVDLFLHLRRIGGVPRSNFPGKSHCGPQLGCKRDFDHPAEHFHTRFKVQTKVHFSFQRNLKLDVRISARRLVVIVYPLTASRRLNGERSGDAVLEREFECRPDRHVDTCDRRKFVHAKRNRYFHTRLFELCADVRIGCGRDRSFFLPGRKIKPESAGHAKRSATLNDFRFGKLKSGL